jgi:GT2 family glycosyltransferase
MTNPKEGGGITAIITAYQRIDKTVATIRAIQRCEPPPNEILVHVDDAQALCEAAIRAEFPGLRVIRSDRNVGPGGGRNKLIAAAANEFVASFDDDSFPIDADYFAKAVRTFQEFPEADVVTGSLFHANEQVETSDFELNWVADFCGGACVYRREAFLRTKGFVPLPLAYGMEEVDLALQLHNSGGRILRNPRLRVRHDTDRQHQADPRVTAASVANVLLLTYLRYPVSRWWLGVGQVLKRILWLVRHNRSSGIIAGISQTRTLIRNHSGHRQIISADALDSYVRLRQNPTPVCALPSRPHVPVLRD